MGRIVNQQDIDKKLNAMGLKVDDAGLVIEKGAPDQLNRKQNNNDEHYCFKPGSRIYGGITGYVVDADTAISEESSFTIPVDIQNSNLEIALALKLLERNKIDLVSLQKQPLVISAFSIKDDYTLNLLLTKVQDMIGGDEL